MLYTSCVYVCVCVCVLLVSCSKKYLPPGKVTLAKSTMLGTCFSPIFLWTAFTGRFDPEGISKSSHHQIAVWRSHLIPGEKTVSSELPQLMLLEIGIWGTRSDQATLFTTRKNLAHQT